MAYDKKMNTTRMDMLSELAKKDPAAWVYLNDVYGPSMLNWLLHYGIPHNEAEDLIQEVFILVSNKISDFEHNGRLGAFRAWLKAITINAARNHFRKSAASKKPHTNGFEEMLDALEDPASSFTRAFNIEHDHVVIKSLLQQVSSQVESPTLALFTYHVLDENTAAETAKEFNVNLGNVYVAKSRVMRKLRTLKSAISEEFLLQSDAIETIG